MLYDYLIGAVQFPITFMFSFPTGHSFETHFLLSEFNIQYLFGVLAFLQVG